MGMINVSAPTLGEEELAALREVFATNWLGYGERSRAFEAEFAEHVGVDAEQMLLVNSGTTGLFLAMQVLGLGQGDDVVLPSATFVSAGNAVVDCGARPVFCDVDARTLNPTVDHVAAALTPRTKAVVVLHYGGYPGDVAAVARLCRDRGITLIEDTACAVASRAHGVACGTFGDIAVWSFDAVKLIATGDGGMLYVRDRELARTARRLAYFGMVKGSPYSESKRSHRWWDLEVARAGRRDVGNDIIGAIGSVQLRRLAGFVQRRKEITHTYDRLFVGVPGLRTPPPVPDGHENSYYFYWIQVDPAHRDQLAEDLLDAGVYTTFKYQPLHTVPLYGALDQRLPGTDEAAACTLQLPIHQALTDSQLRLVAETVLRSLELRSVGAS